jgi:hypothetical protein
MHAQDANCKLMRENANVKNKHSRKKQKIEISIEWIEPA